MTPRGERKQNIVALVRECKAGLRRLPRAERAERKRELRAGWKQRRQALKTLPKGEASTAKQELKWEKKIYHRPRRFVAWATVSVIVAVAAWGGAPYVRAVTNLFSLKIDSTTEAGVQARAEGNQVSAQIADEGVVLLANDSDTLPLTGERINIFGFDSFNLRYGGAGSGAANLSEATTLYDALQRRGITPNPDLIAAHGKAGAASELAGDSAGIFGLVKALLGRGAESEPAPDYLTAEVMAQARDYAQVALVVVGNDGAEAVDFNAEQLRLTQNQRTLLEKISAEFEEIVVVVNSGNQMELGFLEEFPQITAALWLGTPGPYGAEALARVLTGEVNPSGRLPVTYAYSVESAPAVENFGDYRYANAKRALLNYEEGIYVGYRFYETFYDGDEPGYAAAVQFPFGYGLGYSTFAWSNPEVRVVGNDIRVNLTVTNTGGPAGKDVVQVYASAPYTPGGIEKPVRELVGYAKTGDLAPGASESVTLTFPIRDLASWDSAVGGYVLDRGDYEITLATDVHTPVASHALEFEHQIYDVDADSGAQLASRFAELEGDLTYLSRADWAGTYPAAPTGPTVASAELLAAMSPEFPTTPGEAPTYGAGDSLALQDLIGADRDDPRWEAFLDQLTLAEQIDLFINGGWKTAEVARLGIPSAIFLDGPAGLNYFFGSFDAAAYPTEVVLAATWNDDLARAAGQAVGNEALAYGAQGWYAPGMNLHRTPLGGRNFEYFSEDPLLSGRMGAGMIAGAEELGITVFMKHFVLNDQEINARSGVNVWVNEQAMRELYLRPFEISVKEGGASGAMTSFIHLGPRWAGGHEVLLGDVLRGEWGFDGLVTTDAVLGAFMDPVQAAHAGNDIMLSTILPGSEKVLRGALRDDPVGLGWALRDRVHEILFTVANSSAMTP